MEKRRSAYDIPPGGTDLPEDEKRKAIEWWQLGGTYHPLTCPVCGRILALSKGNVALECPARWCSYRTEEIPWAVFVAWQKHREGSC